MDEVQFIEQATLTITRHDVVALSEIEQIQNTVVDNVFVPNNGQQTDGMKWLQYLDHMKILEKEAQRMFELEERKSPAERVFAAAKEVTAMDQPSVERTVNTEPIAEKTESKPTPQTALGSNTEKVEQMHKNDIRLLSDQLEVSPDETVSIQELCHLIAQHS
ncbi:hypothetical protein B8A44_04485 [Dolosigranulum pigrum]|uniref:Uncharacterized protein n=1 Tax=Dolosigranulum pigrum TaxID=29394 RepID=A0A328KLH7_9LACT|nr:hypothetical protein [Dolosigranulum pigrum]QJS96563.1 hypothetical protein B5772_06450 [Dolosigranulum pigrum]QTJ44284.1 hypothetical protein FE328_01255 [Dolosigranulum pigrum]RAN63673.1 hypothetical protein B8A44_04485 [Dolosigranulum pigrum]